MTTTAPPGHARRVQQRDDDIGDVAGPVDGCASASRVVLCLRADMGGPIGGLEAAVAVEGAVVRESTFLV
jgi:hypothetical protein